MRRRVNGIFGTLRNLTSTEKADSISRFGNFGLLAITGYRADASC